MPAETINVTVETEEPCQTILLRDEPAGADAFGSHEQLASAVAELIDREDGGKAAALTGSWGSGKSTTIRLLNSKLAGKASVFVFNAWSHQGDPLRRTFLEQLIDFVSTCGWLAEPKQWKDIKKDIGRRRRIQDVTSTPTLSRDGKILAILLLLTPAGLAMFSRLGEVDHWIAFLGAALSLAPALYVLVVFLYRWTTGSKTEIFEILLKESTTTTKSETIETPEPTSVEFQSYFKKLLSECLSQSNRKLVIVIDNLDRIDAHTALALWSTMSTFFDFSESSDNQWLKALWLLVPFDPSALARLWPDAMNAGVGSNSSNDSDDLARVFVDKTFAITFHVPPPVRSDWRSYLDEQLRKAFPQHAERGQQEFHPVYRIYRLGGLSADRSPTPREIKVFVNNLGAIHRQRRHEVPLPMQAFYVVLSTKTWNLEEELRTASDEELLGSIPIGLVGAEFRAALAAIYFNAPVEKALQLLLGSRAETALLSGDPDKLREFENIYGINQVIEDVVGGSSAEWAANDAASLALASRALSGSGLAGDSSLTESWRMICDAASIVKSWTRLSSEVGEGIVEILNHRKQEDFAKKIASSLAKSDIDRGTTDSEPEADKIKAWLLGVVQVLKAIRAEFPNVLQNFSVPGSSSTFIGVMTALGNNSGEAKEVGEFFSPSVAKQAVVDELVRISTAEKFDEGSANAILAMQSTTSDWPWTGLVEQLKARLNAENTLNVSEVKASIFTLLRLRNSQPAAAKALTFLAQQGHLGHQLYQCNQAKDQKAVALCMFPIMETIPVGTPLQSPGNASSGESIYRDFIGTPAARPELITEISRLIAGFGRAGTLFALAKEDGTKAVAQAILNKLASGPGAQKRIGPKEVIEHYEVLKSACEQAVLDDLIKQSIAHASLTNGLIDGGFKTEMSDLYLAVLRFEENNSVFLDFLEAGLNAIDKDTWSSELNSEGELVKLVIELVRAGRSGGLGIPFQDALHLHAKDLLEGKVKIKTLGADWDRLPNALSESSQEIFFQRISEFLYAGSLTDPILETYGERLLTDPILNEQAERLVLNAFPNFLARGSIIELKWIARALRATTNPLSKVKAAIKKDFTSRVSEAYKENQDKEEVRKEIEEIAALSGVTLPRLADEEEGKQQELT